MRDKITPYEAALRLQVGFSAPPDEESLDSRCRTFRPYGTPDWHLLVIFEGDFVIDAESDHPEILHPRSAVLFPPHVKQDYMQVKNQGSGRFFWAHFFPEASLFPLLDWPRTQTAWQRLFWEDEEVLHGQILAACKRCDVYYHSDYTRKYSLSLLVLEEVFRLIFQINPLHQQDALDDRVAKSLQFIAKNLGRAFTLEEISAEIGLSTSRLSHVFSENMHCGVMEYVERQRLKVATGMLRNSQLPIMQIATDCGFSSPYYFSRRFHRAKGMSPTEYRGAHEK